MNPFDFVNAINTSKKDLIVDDVSEKSYVPYVINRQLSYFQDTVLLANEMNKHHQLDNKLQFHFLLNTVRNRKRFSKWFKPEEETDLGAVKEYYGYSNDKARQALTILSQPQIESLKKETQKGGRR
jgi:hypothetical protein